MKIYLATDHAGFELKKELASYLKELGCDVEDCGAYEHEGGDDYPDFIEGAMEGVVNDQDRGKASRGIILGGSGTGEAICANRFSGVRAAVYYGGNKEILTLSREHNDANVLSLGARFLSTDEAKEAVQLWIETKFSGEERHNRRIKKLN